MNEKDDGIILISTYKNRNLYFAIGYSEKKKIVRIALPQKSLEDAIYDISKYHPEYRLLNGDDNIVKNISRMYHGENLFFDLGLLELDSNESSHAKSTVKTSFERGVILEVSKIEYGTVKTYKEIAKLIDSHAYRAVGTAIGKNPFPIVIPCHRVIRSDGKIGGFRGGTPMKVEILKNEGIKIDDGGIKIIHKFKKN